MGPPPPPPPIASATTTAAPIPVADPAAVAAAASAAVASSSSFSTFQNDALAQTNKYRALHCAPNMKLNTTLNSIAQAYADKLAATQTFAHSNNGYGENLYYTMSSSSTGPSSVKGIVYSKRDSFIYIFYLQVRRLLMIGTVK